MLTRRSFFSKFGAIIATSVSATIFVPSLIKPCWKHVIKTSPILTKLRVTWTCEMAQDLQCYHHILAEDILYNVLEDKVKNVSKYIC